MPVRPRRSRVRRVEWSARIAVALTAGPDPLAHDLPDAVLAAAWDAYGPGLVLDTPAGSMPWGFWRFAPGVPASLRGDRPALHPIGPVADAADAERDDLHRRRAAWLAEHPTGAPDGATTSRRTTT